MNRREVLLSKIREVLDHLPEETLDAIYGITFGTTLPNPTRQKMKELFLEGYKSMPPHKDYYWRAKDSKALQQIHCAIQRQTDTSDPEANILSFKQLLNTAYKNDFISNKFDLTIINSQFNILSREMVETNISYEQVRKNLQ